MTRLRVAVLAVWLSAVSAAWLWWPDTQVAPAMSGQVEQVEVCGD